MAPGTFYYSFKGFVSDAMCIGWEEMMMGWYVVGYTHSDSPTLKYGNL